MLPFAYDFSSSLSFHDALHQHKDFILHCGVQGKFLADKLLDTLIQFYIVPAKQPKNSRAAVNATRSECVSS